MDKETASVLCSKKQQVSQSMYLDKVALQPVNVGCQVHSPACSRHFTRCREWEDCCQCLPRLAQLQLHYSLLAGQRLVGGKLGGKVSQPCQQVFPLLHLSVTVSGAPNLKLLSLPERLQELVGSKKAPISNGRGREGGARGTGKDRCPGWVGVAVGAEVGVGVRVRGRGRVRVGIGVGVGVGVGGAGGVGVGGAGGAWRGRDADLQARMWCILDSRH